MVSDPSSLTCYTDTLCEINVDGVGTGSHTILVAAVPSEAEVTCELIATAPVPTWAIGSIAVMLALAGALLIVRRRAAL